VVEVEVDSQGKVRIPNVWTVVDTGTVVALDHVLNQLEGAASFGASLALHGEITVSNGVVNQRTFSTMRLRAWEAHRYIPACTSSRATRRQRASANLGFLRLPPALYNAIYAATGKRVRELPLAKTKLV
jgi:isoquinoline 1-oxidoreductase beta subunit